MTFNAHIRQFATPAALAAYLVTLPAPDWPGVNNPRGSTCHNTYKPIESQWVGKASMESMQRYYEAKGWSSGPHFYLALGCPRRSDEGIWQMTPPTSPGTHAGACNAIHFGIELVGNFHDKAPSLPQQALLLDTLFVLHRWAGLGAMLNAHRDCMTGRTCPGDAFYALLPSLRAQLAARLNHAGTYAVRHTQAIFEAPRPDSKVALNDTAEVLEGARIEIDEVKNGWAHLTNQIGFIPVGVLTKL